MALKCYVHIHCLYCLNVIIHILLSLLLVVPSLGLVFSDNAVAVIRFNYNTII